MSCKCWPGVGGGCRVEASRPAGDGPGAISCLQTAYKGDSQNEHLLPAPARQGPAAQSRLAERHLQEALVALWTCLQGRVEAVNPTCPGAGAPALMKGDEGWAASLGRFLWVPGGLPVSAAQDEAAFDAPTAPACDPSRPAGQPCRSRWGCPGGGSAVCSSLRNPLNDPACLPETSP